MQIIKKWGSSVAALVAAILALALSACSGMVATTTAAGVSTTETTKAIKVLTDSELLDQAELLGLKSEFSVMILFSIILTVAAIALIVFAAISILKNLNVVRINNKILSIIGLSLAGLFLVATIGVLASSMAYADSMADIMSAMYAGIAEISITVGVFQPTMLVVGIICPAVIAFCEFKSVKE